MRICALKVVVTPHTGTDTAKRSTAHSRVSSYSGTVGVVCQSEAEV